MSVVRSPVRSVVRSPVRSVVRSDGVSALGQILAFSPSLLIWPAEATMTQATNGTGAAPGVGNPVGRILDLSPNGNNLIAGTWATPADAARGQFQNNAINFSGVDDYYSLLNAISITENMTVVRAFKRSAAGINSVGLGNSGANAPNAGWWINDNNSAIALGGSASFTASPSTATGSFVDTAVRSASAQALRRNGTVIRTGTPPTVSGVLDVIGRAGGNSSSGEISFVAVFASELTGADLALVEQIAAATNGAVLA